MNNHEDVQIDEEPDHKHVNRESFLNSTLPYIEWAIRDSLELVFHGFTDATDTWEEDPTIAYDIFQAFIVERGTGRLYVELYEDRENDVMVHEDCLLSIGFYPL